MHFRVDRWTTDLLMLSDPYFHNEAAAFAFVEARLWPDGPVCPHCRCTGTKVGRLKGQTTRRGLYKCYGCQRPFRVTIGTPFESSHVRLHLWLQAIYLLACCHQHITVRQLQETLGIARKTAWVLRSRIRQAIARDDGALAEMGEPAAAGVIPTAPDAVRAGARATLAAVGGDRSGPPRPADAAPKRREHKRRVGDRQRNPRQRTLF